MTRSTPPEKKGRKAVSDRPSTESRKVAPPTQPTAKRQSSTGSSSSDKAPAGFVPIVYVLFAKIGNAEAELKINVLNEGVSRKEWEMMSDDAREEWLNDCLQKHAALVSFGWRVATS